MAPGSSFDREAGSGDDRYYHLVLLAENNQGYAESDEDCFQGFVEGFIINREWIWSFWKNIMKVSLP